MTNPSRTVRRVDLENNLRKVYDCINQFLLVLAESSRSCQRNSNDNSKRQRVLASTEKRIEELRSKWNEVIDEFFKNPFHQVIVDDLAKDLVTLFQTNKKQHKVRDESYKSALSCIVTSIIALIMDERRELTSTVVTQQRGRATFISKLLVVKIDEENQCNHHEEEIDILNTQESRVQEESDQDQALGDDILTKQLDLMESNIILDLLIEAIMFHSRNVSKRDIDIHGHIYHIINVSYIMNIVKGHLNGITSCLQDSRRTTRSKENAVRSSLKERFSKYRDDIHEALYMFDLNTPMVMFRDDLRGILIQVNLIASTV